MTIKRGDQIIGVAGKRRGQVAISSLLNLLAPVSRWWFYPYVYFILKELLEHTASSAL